MPTPHFSTKAPRARLRRPSSKLVFHLRFRLFNLCGCEALWDSKFKFQGTRFPQTDNLSSRCSLSLPYFYWVWECRPALVPKIGEKADGGSNAMGDRSIIIYFSLPESTRSPLEHRANKKYFCSLLKKPTRAPVDLCQHQWLHVPCSGPALKREREVSWNTKMLLTLERRSDCCANIWRSDSLCYQYQK